MRRAERVQAVTWMAEHLGMAGPRALTGMGVIIIQDLACAKQRLFNVDGHWALPDETIVM